MDAIRLAPHDNIVVLTRSVDTGDTVIIEGRPHRLGCALGPGHKLAVCDIPTGGKIFKYGAPIGSATADIQAGDHVHLHNLQSDYLPTYTLEPDRHFHFNG
jgi:hypothetical protein